MCIKQVISKPSDTVVLCYFALNTFCWLCRLLFVNLCVMINFRLQYNVLCLSFVVVFYSMYSLYAVIKRVLLDERGCHV